VNLINQPEALVGLPYGDFHGLERINMSKAILTYAVPFLVATYGALTAINT
jgi:hypothetical protein